MTNNDYRADIDGLRAIAVLAVVFNHLAPNLLPGGFIGVDVFFVISGYLITSILLREIKGDFFTFYGFYERRARRIFPALFAVLIFVFLLSYFLLLPSDLVFTLRGALGALLFVSNIVFWRDLADGYFAAMNSAQNPLVHTWSLGVEEQFYILFPILLVIFRKITIKSLFLIMSLGFFITLMLSEFFLNTKSVAVFFLTPFRAWELLAGALLAANWLPAIKTLLIRELIGGVGIILILAACFLLDEHKHLFPGVKALLPVLGATFIIYAGSSGEHFVKKILQLRPLVLVGLISYSLYLWHWPLIVFSQYIGLSVSAHTNQFILFLLSIIVATLSYRYVEQPIRSKTYLTRKDVFVSSALFATVFSILCILGLYRDGFENRFDAIALRFDKARYSETPFKSCDARIASEDWCLVGDDKVPLDRVLYGDSHLMSWAPALSKVLTDHGKQASLAMMSNCPPFIGIVSWKKNSDCPKISASFQQYIETHPDISEVIITGYWHAYFMEDDAPLSVKRQDGVIVKGREAVQTGLITTLQWLEDQKKRVILIGPVPTYDRKSVPLSLALDAAHKRTPIHSTLDEQIAKNSFYFETLKTFTPATTTRKIEPIYWICRPECLVSKDGESLYRDSNHLNVYGAMMLEPEINKALDIMILDLK
jgi:peptidoglycan/LPS O-acetylase OafA/YrhL